jgi:uncharacterized phage protein (TIGR01671 family)
MNREILFRGKRADNGEWIHGSIIHCNDGYYIADYSIYMVAPNMVKVVPESVGQFTGLIDFEDNRIFEGDIVKWQYAKRVINKDGFYVKTGEIEGVFFEEVKYEAGYYHLGGYDPLTREEIEQFDYVVCGNIHDNPELINEGGEQ